MSTPSLPPPMPPNLVDLRQQHERLEGQLRTARLVVLGASVVFALFLALLAGSRLDGLAGLALGVLTFAILMLSIALCVAISLTREKEHAGPAGRGPSSFGQVVTSAPGPQVWESVNAALRELKFVPGRPIDPQTVVSTRSLSMASWGETLTIRIVSTTDGRGLVTVWSRPAYPLQWIDYGRNRKYANAVLGAVPGAETVREPDVASRA
ncbi:MULTISPECIES: hypothetical protein [unclassified Knoellia]|uniref:hypothetical protein n=1 Tax=Knoellia altitudinis TaxID=3404795 RepID=UPI0036080B19